MIYLTDKQIRLYISLLFIGWLVAILYFDLTSYLAFALGILIPLLQRIVSLDEAKKIEEFTKLGLLRVLPHRDDEEHYRKRIQKTKRKLFIMGHTSKRLIEDFADENGRVEKRVLLEALSRGVSVKILIAHKSYLSENKLNDYEQTMRKMNKIKEKFDKFEFKYYKHIPSHSLFLFDNECLLGPIFTELESRDTPTLDMKYDCEFAEKYLEHFNIEWSKAVEH